jgi:hypothetical protein
MEKHRGVAERRDVIIRKVVALSLSAASVGLTASRVHAEHGHVSIGIGIPVAPAVPPPQPHNDAGERAQDSR